MSGLRSRARGGAAVAALIAVPIGIHAALATNLLYWAGTLVVADAALIAWIALSFLPARPVRWCGAAAVAATAAATWRFAPSGVVAAAAIPHAVAYLCVLTLFARSLLPARRPIITIFAERSRGTLPPAVARYTRRVTWAWCLFCAAQLLTSLGLLLFAPIRIWSDFVNLCNFPLLVAMFAAEFAWRTWRHGAPRERLLDGFRMARELNVTGGHDPA